ncbi:MAG: NUDIX hydrolase [Candidatus Aenigmarchaeota archaeon]|nr:NUDIX hydrolase [Candidatus Aenigmarchaeota archaeon]
MPTQNGPWTIKGSRNAYKNPWISVREDSVIDPSGKDTIYGVIELHEWLLILPVDKDRNVYLTKQFRYALGADSIEVPAGCADPGEDPLTGAKRELKEEMGITAKKWTLLGKSKAAPGGINNTIYLFLAEDLSFGNTKMDETENITSLKVPLEKALKMVEKNEILDVSSTALILRAKRFLDKR